MELSSQQAAMMSGNCDESVSKIKQKKLPPWKKPHQNSSTAQPSQASQNSFKHDKRQQNTKTNCRNCGGHYPHSFGTKCPAIGADCHYCHKSGHFITVCRKRQRNNQIRKPVREIQEESENSENDSTFGVKLKVNQLSKKVPKRLLKINDHNIPALVDTGSSINIIAEYKIKKMSPQPQLMKCRTKAFAFGQKKPLPMNSKCTLTVETQQ